MKRVILCALVMATCIVQARAREPTPSAIEQLRARGTVLVSDNGTGGEVILTFRDSARCPANTFLAINTTPNKAAQFGCWVGAGAGRNPPEVMVAWENPSGGHEMWTYRVDSFRERKI